MDLKVGIRVIRGPDWEYGNQDGGRGYVGTITNIQDTQSPPRPANTVIVQWDNGRRGLYRTGHQRAFDLRVFDSAPAGISHFKIWCDGCEENEIKGIRWRCTECFGYDLCTDCYMTKKHDLNHPFMRVNDSSDSSLGPVMPPRSSSHHIDVTGVFPGARVVKWPRWITGGADDGPGEVVMSESYREDKHEGCTYVSFASGVTSRCRIGRDGLVELACTFPASAGQIFDGHLPNLGDKELMGVGDKVVITVDSQELEKMQKRHNIWDSTILSEIGKEGRVNKHADHGDLLVHFVHSGETRTVNPSALTKLHSFCAGQTVQINSDTETVKRLQEDHGGWKSYMIQLLGKRGKVVKVKDGNVHIKMDDDNHSYVFNPLNLSPRRSPIPLIVGHRDLECAKCLETFIDNPIFPLATAAREGDKNRLNQILDAHPDWVNSELAPARALLCFVAEECDVEMLEIFTRRGAFIERPDEMGHSPLMRCVLKNKYMAVKHLLEMNAEVDATNIDGQTSLLLACREGFFESAQQLLQYGADINRKSDEGCTPLSQAMLSNSRTLADILLERTDSDLKTRPEDTEGSVLHHAAYVNNGYATMKLVQKIPRLVDCRDHRTITPLMTAARVNASNVAEILIKKGRCDINAIDGEANCTALSIALAEGQLEVLEVLVRNGADCNIADVNGHTSLHFAASLSLLDAYIDDDLDDYPFLIQMKTRWGSHGITDLPEALLAYLVTHGAKLDVKDMTGISLRLFIKQMMGETLAKALAEIQDQRSESQMQQKAKKPRIEQPNEKTSSDDRKQTVHGSCNTKTTVKSTETGSSGSHRPEMHSQVKKQVEQAMKSVASYGTVQNDRQQPLKSQLPGINANKKSSQSVANMEKDPGVGTSKQEIQRLQSLLKSKDEELMTLRRQLQEVEHLVKRKIKFACGHHVTKSIADLIPECPTCCASVTGVESMTE